MTEVESLLREVESLRGRLSDANRRLAEAEQALAEATLGGQASERRYRRVLETAGEGVWQSDASGRVALVNGRMASMLGYTPDEMVGRSVLDLVHESAREAVRAQLALRRSGRGGSYETTLVGKDGRPVWAEVNAAPLLDTNGAFEGSLAMVTDVTKRKRAEEESVRLLAELARELRSRAEAESTLRKAEDQVRQLQKMDAIGSLAAGIAHDFNNLLSVVLTYATLAQEGLQAGDPLRDDLAQIRLAGERAAELTRQLLAFSRQQILEPRVVRLDELVVGMEKMLRRLVGEHVELKLATDPDSGAVMVDPGQFEQVVLNLVVNAKDAMPRGGRLTIETGDVTLDEAGAPEHVGMKPAPYVMMAVTDTGHGMDRETQERIFEPFFTTKAKGKGTGLGLATAFGIVRQSGGHIWVKSEPGLGSTFKVLLPRVEPAEGAAEAPRSSPGLEGRETILLVEDEDSVRQIALNILRRYGYAVLPAANAGEALLLCEQHGGTIDLLLTDVVMPLMSGRELAERLGRVRPGLPVLYMSGYTDDAIMHHGVLDPGVAYLQKPIRPEALARKVREVLGNPPAPTRRP